MSIINALPESLTTASSARTTVENVTQDKVSRDDFLKLMLAQLKNQDPLKPLENAEFVSQLAQINTLDSVNELNNSFSSLANSLSNNQTLQAATLVGKHVEVPSNKVFLDSSGEIRGNVQLPQAANNVKLSIANNKGEVVKEISLGHGSGALNFTWDGVTKNGERAPSGEYNISATGQVSGDQTALSTTALIKVESVSYSKESQQISLGLANQANKVPLNKIVTISQ